MPPAYRRFDNGRRRILLTGSRCRSSSARCRAVGVRRLLKFIRNFYHAGFAAAVAVSTIVGPVKYGEPSRERLLQCSRRGDRKFLAY